MGYTPVGIGGNSPQGVGLVRTDYNFLGAQTLNGFSVLHPDVDPSLTKRYGYQDDIISMFDKLGLSRRVTNSTIFRHYEEERLRPPVVMDASNVGGAGATVIIPILAAAQFSIPQESPYIGAGTTTAVAPRLGDVGFFSNNVEAVVTAVAADGSTFSATPTQTGEVIPEITSGDEFVITSAVANEASTFADRGSFSSRVIYYQNNTQIFTERHEISGSALGEETWIDFDGKYGAGKYWYYYDMDRTFRRHKNSFANGCIFGKDITNVTLAGIAGFEQAKKTKGLIPTIQASGINEAFTTGALTLADVENVLDDLTEQSAANEYMLLCSQGFRKDFNKLFREGDGVDFDQASRASIIFEQFNGGVQSVDFDVDSAKHLGYTLNIKTQRAFSDPTQQGAITAYNSFAVGMPMGEVNIYEELGGNYVSTPAMQVVYKGSGPEGGDRSMDEYVQTPRETGKDNLVHVLVTEGGVETNAINHCFTMQGS